MTSQRVAQAARNLDDTTGEAVPGAAAADAGGQVHDGRGRLDLYFEPAGRKVRVPPGVMLFDAASWNGIAIDSTCGGHGTCRKCKVKVLEGAAPITSLDTRAYTTDELRSGWRLACRVQVATDLRVEVPPLVTRPKAATVGVGRKVILRPAVQKRYVELSRADLGRPDNRSRAPAGEPRRPGAASGPARDPVARAGAARKRLQAHRRRGRRRAHRRRARRHDRAPVRDRVRPRHDDGRRDAPRPVDGHARGRRSRCSTRSRASEPTSSRGSARS